MSLRAQTVDLNTFFVSRLMNIARHVKVPRTLIEKLQSLSLKANYGEGKKTEIALYHLQPKVNHGGIGWPNLRLKILAAKVIDMKNCLFGDDANCETNFLKNRKNRNRSIRRLLSEVKSAGFSFLQDQNIWIKQNAKNFHVTRFLDRGTWKNFSMKPVGTMKAGKGVLRKVRSKWN